MDRNQTFNYPVGLTALNQRRGRTEPPGAVTYSSRRESGPVCTLSPFIFLNPSENISLDS